MAKNKNEKPDEEPKGPDAGAIPDAPPPDAEVAIVETDQDVVTVEAVVVDLPPLDLEPRDWYYIGVIDACPTNVIHIAGIDFPKFSDPPRETGDGEQFRHRMRGKLVRLTPKQVNKVRRDVLDQFFQMEETRVQKKTKKNVYYKPARNDRNVALFAFMQKTKNPKNLNRDIMSETPRTMALCPPGYSLYPEGFDPSKRMNNGFVGRPIMNVPEDLRQTPAATA